MFHAREGQVKGTVHLKCSSSSSGDEQERRNTAAVGIAADPTIRYLTVKLQWKKKKLDIKEEEKW